MFNAATPNVLTGKDAQFLARFCLQPSIHDHYISGSWLLALFSSIPALIPHQEIFVPYFEGTCTMVSPLLTRAPAEPFQFKHELSDSFPLQKKSILTFSFGLPSTTHTFIPWCWHICHHHPCPSTPGRICLIRNCSSATAELEE